MSIGESTKGLLTGKSRFSSAFVSAREEAVTLGHSRSRGLSNEDGP